MQSNKNKMEKIELIRPIVRVGNSAGVVLPREWINGEARIILVRKPNNLKSLERDVFLFLSKYLSEIKGLYLVGSYARGEQTIESDVDILAVTNSTNLEIDRGKYKIILISQERLEEQLKENILPWLAMIVEAKAILNKELVEKYKKTELNQKNLKFHFETTLSSLQLIKKMIDMAEKDKEMLSENLAYPLILRLREAYIVECLMKCKRFNNKELRKIIKKIYGSIEIYDSYRKTKEAKSTKKIIDLKGAKRVFDYVKEKIEQQERWIKEKNN